MRNKKGFTLIELLIVIIILVVIVLLIVPKILNLLENYEKNSFIVDGEALIDSATNRYLDDVKDNPSALNDRCYVLSELENYTEKEFKEYTARVEIIDREYYVYIENGKYYIEKSKTGEMDVKEYQKKETRKNYSICE